MSNRNAEEASIHLREAILTHGVLISEGMVYSIQFMLVHRCTLPVSKLIPMLPD